MSRLVALLVVALALSASPALGAAAPQANPFLPQQEAPQGAQEPVPQQQAPVQQAPTTSADTGIGSGTILLVVIGLIALVGGIWVVIMRDARRATEGRVRVRTSRTDDPDVARRSGSRPPPRSRKPSPAERRRRKRGRAR
jgi:hypothetical protein